MNNLQQQIIKIDSGLRISNYLRPLFEKTTIGKVHSVFTNGLNFRLNDQLIYLSKTTDQPLSGIGIVPLDENITNDLFQTIEQGNLIRVKPQELFFYGKPNMYQIKFDIVKEFDLSLPTLKNVDFTVDSLADILAQFPIKSIFDNSGFRNEPSLSSMLSELESNKKNINQLIFDFIGRGIGLTPSGDDFLQGYLVMSKVFGQGKEFEQNLIESLKKRRTTDISQAYYQAIFDNILPNQLWQELFLILANPTQENTDRLIAQVELMRHYGHTSGNDFLLGVIHFMKELHHVKKNNKE